MHHLDGAAGKTEGHGPQRTSTTVVHQSIELRNDEFSGSSSLVDLLLEKGLNIGI